ncbi:hypothetical protein, partial [Xanthomonas vasicola]|uniref:hypothetical protein n=1 Tax=Xanthomonas vasicola TaxID=56459 RepID=UPI001F3C3925
MGIAWLCQALPRTVMRRAITFHAKVPLRRIPAPVPVLGQHAGKEKGRLSPTFSFLWHSSRSCRAAGISYLMILATTP